MHLSNRLERKFNMVAFCGSDTIIFLRQGNYAFVYEPKNHENAYGRLFWT